MRKQLVLVSGPIASGKTTVVAELAARARRRGAAAAAVDMDAIVEILVDDGSLVEMEDRLRASDVAAGLVDRLFESGVRLTTVAGSTPSSYEWDELLLRLASQPAVTTVLPRVSLADSIKRAHSDPGRARTLDADFVSRVYRGIDWERLRSPDLDLNTEDLSVDEVVLAIEAGMREEQ